MKMLKTDLNERINWEDYFNHFFFKINNNMLPKFNSICNYHSKLYNYYCV